jgi:hypothetical protein
MIDLNLDQALSKETIQRIHYFAEDTLEDIFRHIDRLKINNENSTGQLRDSIRATVYTNASGNMALVKFFYLYYGECVEQAVGGYYGVDQDLREKGMGLKSPNVGAPPIGGRSYTASDGIIKGVGQYHKAGSGKVYDRSKYHRPRPFLRSTIRRQAMRVGYKLMEECAQLIETRMVVSISDLMEESVKAAFGQLTTDNRQRTTDG